MSGIYQFYYFKKIYFSILFLQIIYEKFFDYISSTNLSNFLLYFLLLIATIILHFIFNLSNYFTFYYN
jgi:hypothetical protein